MNSAQAVEKALLYVESVPELQEPEMAQVFATLAVALAIQERKPQHSSHGDDSRLPSVSGGSGKVTTCKKCGASDVAWYQGRKSGKWYLASPDDRFDFHKCVSS